MIYESSEVGWNKNKGQPSEMKDRVILFMPFLLL